MLQNIKFASFLYSSTKLWNTLAQPVRESLSLASFKRALLNEHFFVPPVNKLYYVGERFPSILHSRLRLGHCALNWHLYLINCKASPSCYCGAPKEDVKHFLLVCPLYAALRSSLLTSIENIASSIWQPLSLVKKNNILLYGSQDLDFAANSSIFCAVREFIINSKRFDKRSRFVQS